MYTQFFCICVCELLSHKLFTTVLEDVIKMLTWDFKGINNNDVFRSQLRFVDDLMLFADDSTDLQSMLQEIYDASLEMDLKINISKTKLRRNASDISNSTVTVGNKPLDSQHLGHVVFFGSEHQTKDIRRRIQLEWAAFEEMKFKITK